MIGEHLRWLRTRLSQLFRRGHREANMEAEMRFHFDHLVDEYRREGLTDNEARLAAQRDFGPSDVYREEVRDVWRPFVLADFVRSIRFAVRSLCRSPWFTLTAVLTLALGVGANTSMFSVLNAVILKPLPYPSVGELDHLFRSTPQDPRGLFSAADYEALDAAASPYGEVAAFAHGELSLADPGQPPFLASVSRVSANFFSVLGVLPVQGRSFRPDEDQFGAHRVCILSERVWLQRLGGDPAAVGRDIRLDGVLHQVVGILPASFNDWRHLGWVDVFVPLALSDIERGGRDRTFLNLLTRRTSTMSFAEGSGWIAAFGDKQARAYQPQQNGVRWTLLPMEQTRLGESGAITLSMLLGLSGFVLLIACSNLANLCLARAISQAREFAVRGALGASRAQLVRPVLVESLVLALTGGACAVLIALWFTDWLRVRSTGDNGEMVPITVDNAVLGWALTASLATAIVVAVAPALFAQRLDLNAVLKSGGRGSTGDRRQRRMRNALIVGQFALALILLTGAALMVRGLAELNNRRAGWDPDNVLTGRFKLSGDRYGTHESLNAFHRRMAEELHSLPGVASVSISSDLPYFTWGPPVSFQLQDRLSWEPGREPAATVNAVTQGYFETVGTPLVAGRVFSSSDNTHPTLLYVINEALARALFADSEAVGQRLALGASATPQWGEIIGVVRDVKSVLADRVGTPYQIYRPMERDPVHQAEFALRTSGVAPAAVLSDVRAAMERLDPDLPVVNLQPADERIRRANYQFAVLRDMLSGIAVLGLALAAVGLYGVVARSTAQRLSEFGVRLALGASAGSILGMVLKEGVRLVMIGSVAGFAGAYGISHLLGAGFPGMNLDYLGSVLASALALIAVALFACYWPARSASRLNPVDALRAE